MRQMLIVAISVLALAGCAGSDKERAPGLVYWTGSLVAHDTNEKQTIVGGDVTLITTRSGKEIVEILLTPESSKGSSWQNIAIRNGTFAQKRQPEGYVQGWFHRLPDEGVVGTFRSHQWIGGFAAARER